MPIDIADLDLMPDDLGVEDVTSYPDPTGLLPPKEGNRVYRIVDFDFHRKKDGTIIKDQERYPVLILKSVEIVEPEAQARKMVPIYQQIRTILQQRGTQFGSQFGDLLRAFDSSRAWKGQEGFQLLNEYVQNGATFKGRGRWSGRDQEYIKAQLASLGPDATKEQKNAVYKAARFVGAKKFRPDGTTVGPSGNIVNARYEIGTFYPSHKLVTIA